MELDPRVNSTFTYSPAMPIHRRPLQDHLQVCVYFVGLTHTSLHSHRLCYRLFMHHMLSKLSVGACGLFPLLPLTDLTGPGALSDK